MMARTQPEGAGVRGDDPRWALHHHDEATDRMGGCWVVHQVCWPWYEASSDVA
jgi:hypothetical protein